MGRGYTNKDKYQGGGGRGIPSTGIHLTDRKSRYRFEGKNGPVKVIKKGVNMTCHPDNIRLVKKQERNYDVNYHLEPTAQGVSSQEEFSHYECFEHKVTFETKEEAKAHLRDGKH